jgi:hypothetical protein
MPTGLYFRKKCREKKESTESENKSEEKIPVELLLSLVFLGSKEN